MLVPLGALNIVHLRVDPRDLKPSLFMPKDDKSLPSFRNPKKKNVDRSKMSNACAGPGRSSPSEPPPEVPLGVPQGTPRYPEGASGRASRKPVKQLICRFCWLTRPLDFTLKFCQI